MALAKYNSFKYGDTVYGKTVSPGAADITLSSDSKKTYG